jgi:hypothetical protein
LPQSLGKKRLTGFADGLVLQLKSKKLPHKKTIIFASKTTL